MNSRRSDAKLPSTGSHPGLQSRGKPEIRPTPPTPTPRGGGVVGRRVRPLLLLSALGLAACGEGSPVGPVQEIEGLPRELSLQEELLIEAGNDFAFRLLDGITAKAPDDNAFLAPLSASMALGMTLNGAAGATFDQMRAALGFGAMSLDEINEGYRNLLDLLLELDPSVEFSVGNSIWYRESFPVRTDFLDRTRTYFDARVEALDFSAPTAAGTINQWVRASTNGKIQEIVEAPIDPQTVMFLINAIYFKGSWTHRFDKRKTQTATFTAEDGSTGTVPLMELLDTLPYTETESYQAVDLPYGGKAFSMTLLLPRPGHTVRELAASLTSASWSALSASLHAKEGTVYLPRFRMEWEEVLNETLKSLGMEAPFSPAEADFSRMSDLALAAQLHISKVKQKTYVDVNEEGTEAAGVTSVEMQVTSMPDRFIFRADRPFLFLIRERFSQTILFAGAFMTPPEV